MFAIKSVLFMFAIVVSFFFPDSKTFFLPLVASFASLFCDFYDIKINVTYKKRLSKVAVTLLGTLDFACMLACVIACLVCSVERQYIQWLDREATVIFFRLDVIGSNGFFFQYIIFAICVSIFMLINMIALAILHVQEAKTSKMNYRSLSLQDLVDGYGLF